MSERQPSGHTEEQLVAHEIAAAQTESREISEVAARTIAVWLRPPAGTALHKFHTTGAIDRERLSDEYVAIYSSPDLTDFERLAYDLFGTHVLHAPGVDEAGNRGPVDGWDERTRWEQA